MNPSRPFIQRPIATSLLMAAVLLVGVIGFRQLPIAALPEVDYPTMQVMTFYPGASADVVASAVTAPLERQLGQVPGLNQMLSSSSDGASVITLQFNLSLNIDVAEQDVQAAINAAQNYLPAAAADAADLQQGQSRGCAHSNPRADLRLDAARASRGLCRHAPSGKNFPVARSRCRHDQRRPEARGARASQSRRSWPTTGCRWRTCARH